MKVLWTLLLGAALVALAEDSTAAVWLGDHSIQGDGLVAETGSSRQRSVSEKNDSLHHGARSSPKSRPSRKRNNDGVKAEFSLEYEHIGCFADNKTDRVLGHLMKSPFMTSAMCAEHCFGRRATYMALQYGNECWCSRYTELDYSRHSGTDKGDVDLCDLSCYGCDAETCGGFYAFDLYKLDGPMPSDSREYVGCFADDQEEDGALANGIKFQDNMTQAVCRVYCERFGSSFYATQYGDECWCGAADDVEEYKRHGDGECIAGCFGDPAIACGGYSAFSLFEYLDADDDATATECADEGSDDDDHGEDAWYTPSPSTARTDSPESPTTSQMPGFMPVDEATCSDGTPGIESNGGACCLASCGQCGGPGCSTFGKDLGLGAEDCCEGNILELGEMCGIAPCTTNAAVEKHDGTTPSPVTPSKPTWEPTSKPTPAPEGRTTPPPLTEPTAEPTSKPTPAAEGRTTPSPVTETTAEPTSKLTPAPEARTTPYPVTEPTAKPSSKLTPAPEAKMAPSPVTTPTAEPTSKPTPAPEADPATASSGGGGDDPGEYQELLERHNQIRCMHGADPLVWSDEVASFAREYAEEMTSGTNCGTMVHSTSSYGENLYLCWETAVGCYTAKSAGVRWYDDEVTQGDRTTYEGHATAMLWTETTQLGCAVAFCQKGGWSYEFLTCNYNPRGNWEGQTTTYVLPPSKTESECSYDGTRAAE